MTGRLTQGTFYRRSRRSIWILALCLAGVAVAGVLFWSERGRLGSSGRAQESAVLERQELAGANLARVAAAVYFRQAGAESLLAVEREIYAATSPEVRARQLVQALIEGPQPEEQARVVPVLPPETRLRQVYLLEGGIAVVDFSGEGIHLLPGGIDSEAMAVEAIRRTLLENLPEFRTVRFLINGKEPETFAGHLTL